MNCFNCGHDLIWDNDFDLSDMEDEKDLIETQYHCPKCESYVHIGIYIERNQ